MNYFRNSSSYQFMHLDLQCIHLEDARKRRSKSWNMLSQFSERRLGMIQTQRYLKKKMIIHPRNSNQKTKTITTESATSILKTKTKIILQYEQTAITNIFILQIVIL